MCKNDLLDVYNQLGLQNDIKDSFYDMNKEYKIRKQVTGRIKD